MKTLSAYSPIEYQQMFHDLLSFRQVEEGNWKNLWVNNNGGIIKSYGDGESIQCGIGSYIIPEDFSIEYCYHADFLHFGIIYEGITYTVADRRLSARSIPSVFLCLEHLEHGISLWKNKQNFRGVEVSINYSYLKNVLLPFLGKDESCLDFMEPNNVYSKLPDSMRDLLLKLEGYITNDTLTPELSRSIILEFISLILFPDYREYFEYGKSSFSKLITVGQRQIKLDSDDLSKIQQVHDIISTEATEFFTIAQLAEKVSISEQKLKYGFFDYYQKTIWEVQNSIRMAKAVELLKSNSYTIDEIAKAVGYQSQTAFHNAFKKWCGLTPGQFKRQL